MKDLQKAIHNCRALENLICDAFEPRQRDIELSQTIEAAEALGLSLVNTDEAAKLFLSTTKGFKGQAANVPAAIAEYVQGCARGVWNEYSMTLPPTEAERAQREAFDANQAKLLRELGWKK